MKSKKKKKDLQEVRVFRVQEVPVTDFWAVLVIRAGQEAAFGSVGDRHCWAGTLRLRYNSSCSKQKRKIVLMSFFV